MLDVAVSRKAPLLPLPFLKYHEFLHCVKNRVDRNSILQKVWILYSITALNFHCMKFGSMTYSTLH